MKTKTLLTLLAFLGFLGINAQVIDVEPVAYWNLDNTPTTTLAEFSSEIGGVPTILYKGDGVSATSTFTDAVIFGKSIRVHDGTPIIRSKTNPLVGAASGSISLWFKSEVDWSQSTGYKTILSTLGSQYFALSLDAAHLEMRTPGGNKDFGEETQIFANTLYHLVYVFDHDDNTNTTTANLYVNGVALGAYNVNNFTVASDLIWHIGTDRDNYHRQPNSSWIDDITMFDVALPADSISKIYNAGLAGTPFQTEFPLVGVVLTKETLYLKPAQGEQLSYASRPSEESAPDGYTWASDNEAVATVDQNGNVTAIAEGNANISITYKRDNTITDVCAVTVGQYAGPLRPLALTNPRAAAAHYPGTRAQYEYEGAVSHDREVFDNLIDDPFEFDPNDMSNANMVINEDNPNNPEGVNALSHLYFCRQADDVIANYYTGLDFLDLSFAKTAYYGCNWVSVDFTIPRGKVLSELYFWARSNKDQYSKYYRMGVMLQESETGLRHSSTEYTDANANNNNFMKFCDNAGYDGADSNSDYPTASNDLDSDGLKSFETIKFTDVPSEVNYSSYNAVVPFVDELLYKSDRCIVMHTNKQDVGLIVAEMRMAVNDAPAWEIDSLSAPIMTTDSTVVKGGSFDLAALKAKYAAKAQFKDVWGYDTTGVVTWDDGGFDLSAKATYTITGTVALPTGTVDANSTVGVLDDITFKVTVDEGTATALQVDKTATIKLYPNPAQSMLTVQGLEVASAVKVFNLAGVQVLSAMVEADNAQVDISDLAAGLYIVTVAEQSLMLQVK